MRAIATVALTALCSTVVSADVTITQTMAMEGQMAALTAGKMPQMVTRVKGLKARADIDVQGQTISSITDLALKQVILLRSEGKTATIMAPGTPPPLAGGMMTMPKVDFTMKPTGQSRTIDGMTCDEQALDMAMDMAQFGASSQMPPEAAQMMKDVKMLASGSLWITKTAPGAEEFIAFQKAALDSNMLSALSSMIPSQGGMEKLIAAATSAPGIPCVMEITMSFEGTGPMVDAMKQMGPMKMVQKTTKISLDPVPDSAFTIPADYKVENKVEKKLDKK